MIRSSMLVLAITLLACASPPHTASSPSGGSGRQMERLNRGLVAVHQGGGRVFVSWRLLGTDPDGVAFNLYRIVGNAAPVRVNAAPLTEATSTTDSIYVTAPVAYLVRAIVNGAELAPSERYVLRRETPYLSLRLRTPEGYTPNDGAVGDLDGDGAYELVVHQVGRGRDNSQRGVTTNPILEAYRLDGTFLWRIDLGKNVREGAHYTQFIVYDLDGDGRAEVACKTADGTVDGTGKIIGDASADHRNADGFIVKGPEFLTVFDGRTGAALATTGFIPRRHPETDAPTPEQQRAVWGDANYNRMDRFLAGVAYLDGVHPSLIMTRGYYTRAVLTAWDWRGGKLSRRWTFDSDSAPDANRAYRGQGNHQLSVADVDGDGRDEIIYGAATIDDDGRGLYSTGLGHGDALHVSDLDPDRPGLEVFDIQERFDDSGANFRDARTGEVLWKKASIRAGADGEGPGRGNSFDVDPRTRGAESWVAGAGLRGIWSAKGALISEKQPTAVNFGIWWDGDLLRELLDRNLVYKWNWTAERMDTLFVATDAASNNGTKSTPVLSGDILGDWREEIILRVADDPRELRLYTSTSPTPYRFTTLMHDPVYRLGMAWQNVAYNQPPHVSYYLGDGMAKPARSRIFVPPAR
ncbi:MAG TPA: rhamnogalacturonan lyase [Gemmatimonadaceae bacterium]|nr:rhamnogalacturonan lyase [Gemmatimonadaceae bacterium]